jgi:hypothetical protein
MRGRRQQRRDERRAFGPGGEATRYQMREKLLSIGDDSWIENAAGEHVVKVNGKALRARQTLILEDLDGNELCKIQERKLRVKDSMEIEGPGGNRLAMVKQALVTPMRARFDVKVQDGPDLRVQATSLITNTRSRLPGPRSRRSLSAGSGCVIPTGSRSRRARTRSSSSRSRSPSTLADRAD